MGERDEQTASGSSGPSLRLTDLVRMYDGRGDILEWLNKLELVAKLRGLDRLENVIPLFLEGSAYSLYTELSEEDKQSEQAIKRRLVEAYGVNPYQAYEQFIRRVWRDEPVDTYLTDLRRLARLADVASDGLIKKAFVVGLPRAVSRELRASSKMDGLTLPQLVERARVLLAETQVVDKFVTAVAVSPSDVGQVVAVAAADGDRRPGKAVKCYRCGGPHIMRYCPSKPKFKCWVCGVEGHLAKNCGQGNGQGGATVAVAPQQKD